MTPLTRWMPKPIGENPTLLLPCHFIAERKQRRHKIPISKANQARYPKNWKSEVVPRIRARSKDRCECEGECGLRHVNYNGAQLDLTPDQVDGRLKGTGMTFGRCMAVNGQNHPVTGSMVVLTVGHINHAPEDCRDEVLKHWCQRCHLRYHRTHHQINARATRDRKAGQERMDI